jgi:hypothetical protein
MEQRFRFRLAELRQDAAVPRLEAFLGPFVASLQRSEQRRNARSCARRPGGAGARRRMMLDTHALPTSDGYPDVAAARLVAPELRLATASLAVALAEEGLPYRRFERWGEVAEALLRT